MESPLAREHADRAAVGPAHQRREADELPPKVVVVRAQSGVHSALVAIR
jgi:hypothetical protein